MSSSILLQVQSRDRSFSTDFAELSFLRKSEVIQIVDGEIYVVLDIKFIERVFGVDATQVVLVDIGLAQGVLEQGVT